LEGFRLHGGIEDDKDLVRDIVAACPGAAREFPYSCRGLIQGEYKAVPRIDDKGLAVYHAQTRPLVEYYAKSATAGDARAPKHRKVNGMGSVEAIREAVKAALAG
jgi:hypothetical protein